MTELSDLYALRDMLDKATGPSRELDAHIELALGVNTACLCEEPGVVIYDDCGARPAPNFTSSIAAAEALRQQRLPGWLLQVRQWSGGWIVTLSPPHGVAGNTRGKSPIEPLARLKATVAAMIATKEQPR